MSQQEDEKKDGRSVLGTGLPDELKRRLLRLAGGRENLDSFVLQLLQDRADGMDRLVALLAGDDEKTLTEVRQDLRRVKGDLVDLRNTIPGDLREQLFDLKRGLEEQTAVIRDLLQQQAHTYNLLVGLITGAKK
jgi:hypothetical protein